MTKRDARAELMDAAERLYVEHGIHGVAERKISAVAGNTNNSAVTYYFGGRAGLLRAMIDRHLAALEPARQDLFAQSDSLHGDLRALVLPVVETLSALPAPSWRARFMNLAANDPMTAQMLRESADQAPVAARVFASIARRVELVEDVAPEDLAPRAGLMTYMVGTACAETERRGDAGKKPDWPFVGRMLCDAIAGMLCAPSSPG